MKIQDNIGTIKIYPVMQYYDVTTNSRWRTAVILKIVTSPYLGENSSDFNKIWYMSADYEPDESRMSRIEIFLNPRWRTAAILKIGFLGITPQPIVRFH